MQYSPTLSSIYPVTCHTHHVGLGSTFVAIKGHKEDGINYIPQALAQGATKIVIQADAPVSSELAQIINTAKAHLITVDNSRAALAYLSAQALGFPAQKLKIIGITGTKGKTTCAWLLFHILKTAGCKTALLSTVRNYINDQSFPTELTTQHPDYLHVFFDACVKAGIEYVVMEVAAQALSLHRVETLLFDGIIFTNFAQEHGEFYPSLDDYFAAKSSIMRYRKAHAPVIINSDNSWCRTLLAQPNDFLTFGSQQPATYYLQSITTNLNGISFDMHADAHHYHLQCPNLMGSFNAENATAVAGMALSLGIDIHTVASALQSFTYIPGRLARYQLPNGAIALIDYAHNPSSFQALLPLLRSLTAHLILVFGCGGERDRHKRPIMGAIAAEYADTIFLTTDNPRSELPASIIHDIFSGIAEPQKHKVIVELNRERAITNAYAQSYSGSLIALLGKGPEEYQHIGTTKLFFSEEQILHSLSGM